jgi:hypothetical protein
LPRSTPIRGRPSAAPGVIPVTHRTRKRNTGLYVGSEGTHLRPGVPVATRIDMHTTSADRRRTLAWHIARRPGGLAALAVQYGHLRTIVSEGYSNRSRDGIDKLVDVETARDIAERLSDLNEAIENNEGISGPAALRLMDAAAREHHRFGGIITTHRQARALLDDPGLTVFENQRAFLLCNYVRDKALCHTGRAKTDAPSLDRCQPRCANIARTDHHAAQMLQHARQLQAQAGAMPTPLADRLRAEAEALTDRAQQHFDDRINDRTAQ